MKTEKDIEQEKKDFKNIGIYDKELKQIPNEYNFNRLPVLTFIISISFLFGFGTTIPFLTAVAVLGAGFSGSVIFDNQIQKLILKAKIFNIRRRFRKMDEEAKGKKNILSKLFNRSNKKESKKGLFSTLKDKWTNRKKKENKLSLSEKFNKFKERFSKPEVEEIEEDVEYIPGTDIPKPGIRGIDETDEEYVDNLSKHYEKYKDSFEQNKSKISNLKIVPSVCNAVFYEDGSYTMTKEQLNYLNKVQDKDIMTKENINNICNMYGAENTNTNPSMEKVKILKKVA